MGLIPTQKERERSHSWEVKIWTGEEKYHTPSVLTLVVAKIVIVHQQSGFLFPLKDLIHFCHGSVTEVGEYRNKCNFL